MVAIGIVVQMLVYHQPPIPTAVRYRGKYDPIILREPRSNLVQVSKKITQPSTGELGRAF
jgi:hypothetical protein